jgi:hypothetical protein
MGILEEDYLEPAIIETATAEDFAVPEHEADWLVIGGTEEAIVTVCRVCGKTEVEPVPANDLGGQDPFPVLGSDEYLTW